MLETGAAFWSTQSLILSHYLCLGVCCYGFWISIEYFRKRWGFFGSSGRQSIPMICATGSNSANERISVPPPLVQFETMSVPNSPSSSATHSSESIQMVDLTLAKPVLVHYVEEG